MFETLQFLIGPDTHAITWWQMTVRAVIIFFYILMLLRLGAVRVFAKNTSYDIVVAILLGSTLSRGMTGNAPFLPILVSSAAIVALHRILAVLAFHNKKLSTFIKGKEIKLVSDGKPDRESMKKTNVTEQDILEASRIGSRVADLNKVGEAFLERNGRISVIPKETKSPE